MENITELTLNSEDPTVLDIEAAESDASRHIQMMNNYELNIKSEIKKTIELDQDSKYDDDLDLLVI